MIVCRVGNRVCKDYHRGLCRSLEPCSYKGERKRGKRKAMS